MGLAATKRKQKIQADPRNTAWVDDASRFGQAYLAKFGWTNSDGLGANKDGRTNHIAIAQKLNMLGIGANRPDGPEAIAWKQNQDFESVLKRLNEESQSSSATPPAESESTPAEDAEDAADERSSRKEEKRRRKEEKRARKEEKAKRKLEKGKKAAADSLEPSSSSTPPPAGPKVVRMAHRARHRASKAMLSSATALAEVLGESSSAPTPREPSPPPPKPTLTPISDEKITTSTINMVDYFRSKIQAKVKSTSAGVASEIGEQDEIPDEERPSIGFGAKGLFSFPTIQSSYGPVSEVQVSRVGEDVSDVAARSDDEGPVAKLEAGGEKIASKTGEEGEAPSKKKKRRSSEAQEEETDKSRKKKKKRKD